jgi:hypothetical protein
MRVRFSANKFWMNWQSMGRAQELDALMHAGFKKWPAAFSTDYMKTSELAPLEKWAAELRQLDAQTLIVIGIGGSSLGGIALKALIDAHSDRLIFWEGPHPSKMQKIAQIAEQKQTAVLVVSKSGTTLETRANLSLFRQFFPGVPEYFVTSEPAAIRDLGANSKNTFLIPKELGGRFSIVSPVGMMPAMFVDYNVKAFLTAFDEANAEWEISIPVAENVAKQTAIHFYNLFAARFTGVALLGLCRRSRRLGALAGATLGRIARQKAAHCCSADDRSGARRPALAAAVFYGGFKPAPALLCAHTELWLTRQPHQF